MISSCLASTLRPFGRRRISLPLAFCGLGVFLCGCTAFNPAFLNLFDPPGSSSFATLPNAPGHVVVTLSNQTQIDERLLNFLRARMGLSESELRALRPRLRMRFRVTYVDGSFQTVEFIDGSRNLVDPAFDAQAFPDLNQNDLNNAVVLCDVASVQVEAEPYIAEVFIPVPLKFYELVESTAVGGQVITQFELRGAISPVFWPIEPDEVDADGNVIRQRNVGVRDVPGPTPNVTCGSVVAIIVNGVLDVPFLDEVSPDEPSLDQDDEATVGRLGGRYEFIVTVQ